MHRILSVRATLLFLLLLGSGFPLQAQQYQCMQPGRKQYFTNGNHYLRGMRIDSSFVIGTSTVFYPFQSARVVNPANPYLINSNGGSWLGKQIIQLADGSTLFDNIWKDTIVVMTQAGIGAPWIFYDDTSAFYYTAVVTQVDTMSVLGQLDSVKTIQINAMKGSAILTSNPINNYSIILSKAHGFVRIFDLYTFPYAKPGAAYNYKLDYFLSLNNYQQLKYSAFSQVEYHNPHNADLYDFAAGDVFQYISGLYQVSLTVNSITETRSDSIISKTITPSLITYSIKYVSNQTTQYNNPTPPTSHQLGGGFRSVSIPNDIRQVVDTVKMPEEKGKPFVYYYDPMDSSHCLVSPLYKRQHYIYPPPLEGPTDESETYKVGFGMIDSANGYYQIVPDIYTSFSMLMRYSRKDLRPCGNYIPLEVPPDLSARESFRVYPVPADQFLFLSLPLQPNNEKRRVTISDLSGLSVVEYEGDQQDFSIDVSALPNGIYMLKISAGQSVESRKIVVMH